MSTTVNNGIKIGDIFMGDAGWSMTIPTFYEVTSVSKTGLTVTVRKLRKEHITHDSDYAITVFPVLDGDDRYAVDYEIRRRVSTAHGYGPHIAIDQCETAYLTDKATVTNGIMQDTTD